MEIITGAATKLRTTVSVDGGGKDGHVSTTHIAMFQVNGRQVRLKATEPAMINEGDTVQVAGDSSRGVFHARAYRNLTTHVEGNEGWIVYVGLGSLFFVIGIGTLIAIQPLGVIFAPVGGYFVYRGLRTRRAVQALQRVAAA